MGTLTFWGLSPGGEGNEQWGGAGEHQALSRTLQALLTQRATPPPWASVASAAEGMKLKDGVKIPAFGTFSLTWPSLFIPLSLLPPQGHVVSSQHLR